MPAWYVGFFFPDTDYDFPFFLRNPLSGRRAIDSSLLQTLLSSSPLKTESSFSLSLCWHPFRSFWLDSLWGTRRRSASSWCFSSGGRRKITIKNSIGKKKKLFNLPYRPLLSPRPPPPPPSSRRGVWTCSSRARPTGGSESSLQPQRGRPL